MNCTVCAGRMVYNTKRPCSSELEDTNAGRYTVELYPPRGPESVIASDDDLTKARALYRRAGPSSPSACFGLIPMRNSLWAEASGIAVGNTKGRMPSAFPLHGVHVHNQALGKEHIIIGRRTPASGWGSHRHQRSAA